MMRALVLALALAACGQTVPSQTAETQPDVGAVQIVGTPQEALAAMPSWENAHAAGVDFRAIGQEPGWLMDIHTRGRIQLSWDYGEQFGDFAIEAPTSPQEGVQRYEANSDGRALVVTIRRFPCEDAMSGEAFPSTVEVTIDGRTLQGCGRSV
jgi:uncharacterized membrane protein